MADLMDSYDPWRRPPCEECGVGVRRPGRRNCLACVEKGIAERQAALAQQYQADDIAYALLRKASTPPPPAPGPFRPMGLCPRCGGGTWVDMGNGVWRCGACHFDPLHP